MAQVVTVKGPLSSDKLGVTMSHMHLLCELAVAEQRESPDTASRRALYDKPITMDILGMIRRRVHLVKDNLLLGDVDEAISELMFYKRMGGNSVVEAGVIGLGRDPVGLRQISEATGVNVIASTGWYIAPSHPPFVKEGSIEELCDLMVHELTTGIGSTGIRAGVIKAALSGPTPETPFTGSEEKVLRAAARAQAITGAAMTMHPCHHYGRAKHWHLYLDILQGEGANLEKCFLSHMDFWATDVDYQKTVLDRGVTVAYDCFGAEMYVRPGWFRPPDQSRVSGLVKLIEAGYSKQVLLSAECCYKCTLRKYGGYGYAHVLENILPDLRFYGVTEEQINTMLVDNPRRLLPF